MKFLILFLLSISLNAFAFENECTIELRDKESVLLGTGSIAQRFVGVSSAFAEVAKTTKGRVIIFSGIISSDGYLKAKLEEVDQDKKGFITLSNPVEIMPLKVFYSPYEKDGALNATQEVVMENYRATISCAK